MLGSNLLASSLFLGAAAGAITRRQELYTASIKTVTVNLSSIGPASSSTESSTSISTTSTRTSLTGQTTLLSVATTASQQAPTASAVQNDLTLQKPAVIPDQPDVTLEEPESNDTMSRMATPMAWAPPSGTYRNVVYFTNWGIYGANHQPSNIQAGVITHLLYSFADIKPDGEVVGSDSYADIEKRFPGDSWSESGTNVYGCVKQLYLLKRKNRNMRVLLSIGGWTWSPKFVPVAATEAGRRRFATSAVRLMGDWGFDGLDIDWEYPQDPTQANNFVKLLQACREALVEYSKNYAKGYHFALTIAVPAGRPNYTKLNMKGMIPYVDSWHLMAYDYAGSWDQTTGHQSNLYARSNVPAAIKADTDSALTYYLSQGVDSRKIMLGLPLYGRSFANTAGLGQPYNGVGQGSIEQGIWHYKALPRPGAVEYYDAKAEATYSYDANGKEFVTYDNPASARLKTKYLLSKKLGGAIFWESSGDKTGSLSLVRTVATGMNKLDPMQNWLSYPASKYDNMRRGMK